MICTLSPPRTIEQALADLVDKLDRLPGSHPDVAVLRRQIEGLELHLLWR